MFFFPFYSNHYSCVSVPVWAHVHLDISFLMSIHSILPIRFDTYSQSIFYRKYLSLSLSLLFLPITFCFLFFKVDFFIFFRQRAIFSHGIASIVIYLDDYIIQFLFQKFCQFVVTHKDRRLQTVLHNIDIIHSFFVYNKILLPVSLTS